MTKSTINTSVTIRTDQFLWLVNKREKGEFNLSKKVQILLDEEMRIDKKKMVYTRNNMYKGEKNETRRITGINRKNT